MLRFQGTQFRVQRVVFTIAEARIVEHVVAVVVRADLFDQRVVSLFGGASGGAGHAPEFSKESARPPQFSCRLCKVILLSRRPCQLNPNLRKARRSASCAKEAALGRTWP